MPDERTKAMEEFELLLRAKVGNFVPSGRRHLVDHSWSRKFGPFAMKPLICDSEEMRREISEYARQTFYKEAVVPSSLGLWKPDKSADDIFQKEMDLYLDSGICFVLRCEETSELKGLFLNCIWKRNPDYDAIHGFNMNEWYRTSVRPKQDFSYSARRGIFRPEKLPNIRLKQNNTEYSTLARNIPLKFGIFQK